MSRKVGVLTENSGQGSRHSSVMNSDDSLHIVGCVSTYEKKERVSSLADYLKSQRQYFEEAEHPHNETQYLKAENKKRTEEMLQKAKEELCKRKEKCSGEDTSNIKKVTVPNTKQHRQLNVLEMLHKMRWLQNQNDKNDLESSHKAGDTRNIADKKIVPLKREEADDYFSCTKQTKSKGRRRNRAKTIINLENLEKPLFEAATYQKPIHAQSDYESASAPTHHACVCLQPSPPVITCWQKKAGADLFPDVSTRTLTIYGAGTNEDALLKLAIEESLKMHEAQNLVIDLSKNDHMELISTNTCNSKDTMPLPVPGPVKGESWDDTERMIQGGSVSLQNESSLTAAGQMQDWICSSTEHEDWDMGTSQATSKVNEAAEKCAVRGRNQKRSDTLESLSSNKVFNITVMDTGQYRSQDTVEIDAYNCNSDLNHNVESVYEENIWGPLENDKASARPKNEYQCPIKKHNQIWKNPLPNPNINFGESKTACYMPEVSDSRTQEQGGWNQSKSHIKKQKGDHDHNLMEPLPCSQRNRTVSQCYILEDSDGRTQEQIEWKLKKKQTGKQKGDPNQNLKDLVQSPQRKRRENKTEDYISEDSDGRTQGKVAGNQKKDQTEKQKGAHDQNLKDLVQSPQRKRRENKTEDYISEDSDSRTQGKVAGNQKKDQTEKQKGAHDQNLRKLVQGPQRNRRENKIETYIPTASDSTSQGKVDGNQKKDRIEKEKGDHDEKLGGFVPKAQEKVYWNQKNNLFESQKVSSSRNYISPGEGREKSLKEIQHQECFDFRNQNLTDRKPLYCSDVEWNTKKDNGLDRKKSQGDSCVDSKVKGHGPLSQDAGMYRIEETSLGRDESVGLPGKNMSDFFASKKSEDSGDYVYTNYDDKGVCSDEPQLSYVENHTSEVPVELLNFDLSVQKSPETVQMSPTHIYDTHQCQIPNQFVDSPTCASQLHSVARPLFPLVNSMAGVFSSTGSVPSNMGISMQTHAQQIPNQAFQALPNTDIQKLFELLVQEHQQRLMTMNYLVQMAVMNTTGLPNTNPDSELQAQQSNLTPMMAGLMNSPEQLPTHCNNLLLQNNNALLNPSVPPLLNPSPLSVNQIVAPRNVPLQSKTSSCNREGSALLMPNPYMNMNSEGNRSLHDLSFMLNHMDQTNNPTIYMNSTVSTSLNDSALHGIQTKNPLLMASNFAIGHDHMAHLNYQSTQTQQPAFGNMQNMMQHVAPDVCSQPYGSRPASVGTSSRMVIGKGRGRLIT